MKAQLASNGIGVPFDVQIGHKRYTYAKGAWRWFYAKKITRGRLSVNVPDNSIRSAILGAEKLTELF
jgi:hypothetical protein